jgi:cytidylate kinase
MSETKLSEHLVVAIDGPAGSGKSTVARRVAEALACTLLDTGALYRSLALLARERGVPWDDGPALTALAGEMAVSFRREGDRNRVFLGPARGERDVSDDIRTPEVSLGASRVSAIAEVRAALLEVQRDFARRGSLVAEGRDMGTVVFPDAQVKVFLVADPEVRARRRYRELREAGRDVSFEQVLSEQLARDEADSGREVAPLRPAADARSIDTSAMSIDEVVAAVLERVP